MPAQNLQEPCWQNEFATALIDPERSVPADLSVWNKSDPAKRFAIYRNNVAVNLVDSLCDTFPVCSEIVGEAFFRAMAHVYVRENPPTSRILAEYGRTFGDFIAAFEPAAPMPYLADVARLEFARVEAYHAADAAPVTLADWQAIAPDDLPRLTVRVHPSAQVLTFDRAAVSIWAAHQGALPFEDIDVDEAENVLVIRPGLDVEVIALPPGGAEFLRALVDGKTVSDAASRALAKKPDFDLAGNLGILMGSGIVAGLVHQNIQKLTNHGGVLP